MAGTVVKSRAVLMAKSQVTFKCDRCDMLHPVRCRLEEGFAEEEPDLCTGTYKGCPCRCQKFTKDDSRTVYSPIQEIKVCDPVSQGI
jgi:DNA replicative helicase MCM subunit Mcm2 (Cdc46/Mcm family)